VCVCVCVCVCACVRVYVCALLMCRLMCRKPWSPFKCFAVSYSAAADVPEHGWSEKCEGKWQPTGLEVRFQPLPRPSWSWQISSPTCQTSVGGRYSYVGHHDGRPAYTLEDGSHYIYFSKKGQRWRLCDNLDVGCRLYSTLAGNDVPTDGWLEDCEGKYKKSPSLVVQSVARLPAEGEVLSAFTDERDPRHASTDLKSFALDYSGHELRRLGAPVF